MDTSLIAMGSYGVGVITTLIIFTVINECRKSDADTLPSPTTAPRSPTADLLRPWRSKTKPKQAKPQTGTTDPRPQGPFRPPTHDERGAHSPPPPPYPPIAGMGEGQGIQRPGPVARGMQTDETRRHGDGLV